MRKHKPVVVTPKITRFYKSNTRFTNKDPKQKRIRAKLMTLIVKCDLPLRLVEREEFREFVDEMEPQFSHISR